MTHYWPLHSPVKREVLELNANYSLTHHGHRVKECAFWKNFLPRLLAKGECYRPSHQGAPGPALKHIYTTGPRPLGPLPYYSGLNWDESGIDPPSTLTLYFYESIRAPNEYLRSSWPHHSKYIISSLAKPRSFPSGSAT